MWRLRTMCTVWTKAMDSPGTVSSSCSALFSECSSCSPQLTHWFLSAVRSKFYASNGVQLKLAFEEYKGDQEIRESSSVKRPITPRPRSSESEIEYVVTKPALPRPHPSEPEIECILIDDWARICLFRFVSRKAVHPPIDRDRRTSFQC